MSSQVALYSAVDDRLTHYDVHIDTATLVRRSTIAMSAKVQCAWACIASRGAGSSSSLCRSLYVSTSNGGPRVKSDFNHVAAYAIGADGSLTPHGAPRVLTRRAVHMCLDQGGQFALNAHNYPASGITVHRIAPDGAVGAEIDQLPPLRYGIYPHQVMVFPSGRTVLIVDRGNSAHPGKVEDPGALRSFTFHDGMLADRQVVAPGGGYGFGPRHVVFHPTNPWMYVSDERYNQLHMFRFSGDQVEERAAYVLDTLQDPQNVRPRQLAGPIHVHPNGRAVYVANRADASVEVRGQKIFSGGENNIAVYAIDQESGAPRLVQHADTHSFHVRTFACDPSGRLLITASIKAHAVLEGGRSTAVAAALTVFRIDEQCHLEFVRKVDVETNGTQLQYWMGIVGLA